MRDPVVVCSHLTDETPFTSDRFDVRPVECVDAFSYWHALDAVWRTNRTIVNVEHDMEVSDALVAALLDCPHPVCTYTYRVGPARLGLQFAHDISLVGWHPPIDPLSQYSARGTRWVAPGDEFADFSGIGFVKIKARARIASLRRDAWQGVEISVNRAINQRWHLHWPPIRHFHYDGAH